MNNLLQAFAHGKALIPFITCGDPSADITIQLVYAMEQAGADLIALGIPFSDPTAEGPDIMEAGKRAFAAGITTDLIFHMTEQIRSRSQIPMVFMTYANVVFSYGTERFIKKAVSLGIDGLILPDVPFEEKQDFETICRTYGLSLISMIAPASDNRIRMIAKNSDGFLYCDPSLGETGSTRKMKADICSMIRLAKEAADLPCVVDSGVCDLEQAAAIAAYADGIFVRSAIASLCAQYKTACVPYAASLIQNLKNAMNGVN